MLLVTRFEYIPGEAEEATIELVDRVGREFVAEFEQSKGFVEQPGEVRGVWKLSTESGTIASIGGDVAPRADLHGLFWSIGLEVERIVQNDLACGYLGHPYSKVPGLWVDPDSLECYESVVTGLCPGGEGWFAREDIYEVTLAPDESLIARVDGGAVSQATDGEVRWTLEKSATLRLVRRTEPTRKHIELIPLWIERLCLAIVVHETIGNVCWRKFVGLDDVCKPPKVGTTT
jgi:hypothetical protein